VREFTRRSRTADRCSGTGRAVVPLKAGASLGEPSNA
jgi:hypothetical protein